VENTRLVWNYKDELFKILKPFQTFDSRRTHCEIQGKGSIQTVHPEKMQTFDIKMFKLHDSTGYTWHECLPL